MAVYWPTLGFKGRTFKLCVLTRWDFNFCVRSSPLRGCDTTYMSYETTSGSWDSDIFNETWNIRTGTGTSTQMCLHQFRQAAPRVWLWQSSHFSFIRPKLEVDWQEALVCTARPIENAGPRLWSALHSTARTTRRPNEFQGTVGGCCGWIQCHPWHSTSSLRPIQLCVLIASCFCVIPLAIHNIVVHTEKLRVFFSCSIFQKQKHCFKRVFVVILHKYFAKWLLFPFQINNESIVL